MAGIENRFPGGGGGPSRIVPADALTLVQWKLLGNAGPWLNTGSGGALSLSKDVLTADAKLQTGLFGRAQVFNGTILDSGPTSVGEPSGQAFTMSLWVTPYALTGTPYILLKAASAAWGAPYVMASISLPDASGSWEAYLCTVDKPVFATEIVTDSLYFLALKVTSHLAVTYDGVRLKLYFNGALAKNVAWTGNVDAGAHGAWQVGGLHVGATGPAAMFNGRIEDVRIDKPAAPKHCTGPALPCGCEKGLANGADREQVSGWW